VRAREQHVASSTPADSVQLTWIKRYVRVRRSRDAGVSYDPLQHLRRVTR
jgi:hypothetical protein